LRHGSDSPTVIMTTAGAPGSGRPHPFWTEQCDCAG
jgi:hypothetical protein